MGNDVIPYLVKHVHSDIISLNINMEMYGSVSAVK